jgi:hypothetical protein
VNCTLLPVTGALGDILFTVNASGGLGREASGAGVTLQWFLTEPPGRSSAAQQVVLEDGEAPPNQVFAPVVRRD